ncbi:lysine-rich arabinogalactan protein 19-like [Sinocyclocheilus anshuiensis]|uniref:lysine-rich arabinogalactan protein 19-like n=1 Tax=Sinocyclocheilus anshuiensis TaxID=1608454 RepID=UPI0007B8010E|nr:PREDICTED: lysine-rich arabinogalactan protein 19-like [Sinocyclocheilus anshuiensis]
MSEVWTRFTVTKNDARPTFSAPALRRTPQLSPRLHLGDAGLPASPPLIPPDAEILLHPHLPGVSHLLQRPPMPQLSPPLQLRRNGPCQSYAKCSQHPRSSPSEQGGAPAMEKWTVPKLRQALSNAGILDPHRLNKAELQALYASLQAGAPLPIPTPPSKAKDKTNQGRSAPYSRPDPTTTPSRMSLRPSGRSRRPSPGGGATSNLHSSV